MVIAMRSLLRSKRFCFRLSFVVCSPHDALGVAPAGAVFCSSKDSQYKKSQTYNYSQINCLTRSFSSTSPKYLSCESSSSETLLAKLESAINGHQALEAWETFLDYKRLYHFPKKNMVSRLINMLSCSSDNHWLNKAYEAVLMIRKEKLELPCRDSLIRLSLASARAQIPVAASAILRLLLEKGIFLSIDMWTTIFFHMVKTEIGSCLASNILIEFCECYLQNLSTAKNSRRPKQVKPSTMLFNLVLSSCTQFGSTVKAQQIIYLMRRVGVIADANSINIIARIYEINGQREDLMNLEEHVSSVSSFSLFRHYHLLYDFLLSLHFKYGDIDVAADLILSLLRRSKSLGCVEQQISKSLEVKRPCEVQVGSCNFKIGYKILTNPGEMQIDFMFQESNGSGLVILNDGKLVPSKKAFAKLVVGFLRQKGVGELSCFLASIYKEVELSDHCLEILDGCIQLGWLGITHDILDNFESARITLESHIYNSLYRAYCSHNRLEEAKLLLKWINEADAYDTKLAKSPLIEILDKESKEDVQASILFYELNSSIFFFCKAKMMEDAMKTLKKMQERNLHASAQTFSYLVNGYSSLEMYREITILWGEIKRRMEHGFLKENRDLFECLLWNFIRGGYFERVMEIIHCMNGHKMYIDKWVYKREFLKFHRSLYRNLRGSDAKTEVQKKRLEHVQAFRKWAGIGVKSLS